MADATVEAVPMTEDEYQAMLSMVENNVDTEGVSMEITDYLRTEYVFVRETLLSLLSARDLQQLMDKVDKIEYPTSVGVNIDEFTLQIYTIALLKYQYKLTLPTTVRLQTHKDILGYLSELMYLLYPFGKIKSIFEVIVLCEIAKTNKFEGFNMCYLRFMTFLVTLFDKLGNHKTNLKLYEKKFTDDYVANLDFCFVLIFCSILDAYHEPINSDEQVKLIQMWKQFFDKNRFHYKYSLILIGKIMVKIIIEKRGRSTYWGQDWKTIKKLKSCESPEELLFFTIGKGGLSFQQFINTKSELIDLIVLANNETPLEKNRNLSIVMKNFMGYLNSYANEKDDAKTTIEMINIITNVFEIFEVDKIKTLETIKNNSVNSQMLLLLDLNEYSTYFKFLIFSIIYSFYALNPDKFTLESLEVIYNYCEFVNKTALMNLELESTSNQIAILKILATIVLKYMVEIYTNYYSKTNIIKDVENIEENIKNESENNENNEIIINFINKKMDMENIDKDISKQTLLKDVFKTLILKNPTEITNSEQLASFLEKHGMMEKLDKTFLRIPKKENEQEGLKIDFKALCDFLRNNYGIDNSVPEVANIINMYLNNEFDKVTSLCSMISPCVLKSRQYPIVQFLKYLNNNAIKGEKIDCKDIPSLIDLILAIQLIFSNSVGNSNGSYLYQLWNALAETQKNISSINILYESTPPIQKQSPMHCKLMDLYIIGMPISDKLVILDSIGINRITGLIRCKNCKNVLVWYDNNCGQPTERPGMPVECKCGAKGILKDHSVSGDIKNLYRAQGRILDDGINEFITKNEPKKGFYLFPEDKKPSELACMTMGKCFPKALYLIHLYLSSIVLLSDVLPPNVTEQKLINNAILCIKTMVEIYGESVDSILQYSLAVAPSVATYLSKVKLVSSWGDRLKVEDKLSDLLLNISSKYGTVVKQAKSKMLKKKPFSTNAIEEIFYTKLDDQDILDYVFARKLIN